MDYGTVANGDEEDAQDVNEEQFVERLRELWGRRFGPAKADAAWRRVVFGCQVLIDNCCDPDADTLEWKPEIAALIQGAAK